MSNILSASSRTKYVQRRQFVTRPGRKTFGLSAGATGPIVN